MAEENSTEQSELLNGVLNNVASNFIKSTEGIINLNSFVPEMFNPLLPKLLDRKFFSRLTDAGIINPESNESIVARDGSTNQSPSPNSASKTVGNGPQQQSITQNNETRIITNRLRVDTDEVIINSHKLNPWLWEYSDFKSNQDQWGSPHQVGNFCLFGTVMVKAWDRQLKKYVLIRRLARMPFFAPILDVPQIDEGLEIISDTERPTNYVVKGKTSSALEYYTMVNGMVNNNKQQANQTSNNSTSTRQNNASIGQIGGGTTSNSPGRVSEDAAKAEEQAKQEAARIAAERAKEEEMKTNIIKNAPDSSSTEIMKDILTTDDTSATLYQDYDTELEQLDNPSSESIVDSVLSTAEQTLKNIQDSTRASTQESRERYQKQKEKEEKLIQSVTSGK